MQTRALWVEQHSKSRTDGAYLCHADPYLRPALSVVLHRLAQPVDHSALHAAEKSHLQKLIRSCEMYFGANGVSEDLPERRDKHGDSDGSTVALNVRIGHMVSGDERMDSKPFVPSLHAVAAAQVFPAPGGGQDVALRFTLLPDVRLKPNVFNFGPKNVQFLANGISVAEARLEIVPDSSMCVPTSFAFYNAITR